jgi:hypothetical protein
MNAAVLAGQGVAQRRQKRRETLLSPPTAA